MSRVYFRDGALRDLDRIDRRLADLIVRRIHWMADRVNEVPHHALRGGAEGDYRFRVGDYRVIYNLLPGQDIEVVAVGHRRDVYR